MCLYPRLVENKRYTPNQKNGGIIPPVYDKRALATPIGCGNCMECRKQKAREWRVRLSEDIKHNPGGQMVTLTFSTEALIELAECKRTGLDRKTGEVWTKQIKELKGYDRDNAIATQAVRYFTERWRKKYKKTIRHWLITELGTTRYEHLHLHGIVWGNVHEVEKIWQYGFIYKGDLVYGRIHNYVNGRTISYMTKYVSKVDYKHKEYKPIVLCSKGIGAGYKGTDNKFNNEKTRDYYKSETGHKMALPTYWRRKLFTDDEREMLWMNMLDKNTRYVNGQKIDLNLTDEQDYFRTLKEAQELNKKLGYKDGINWKRKTYEEERRNLIWEYRMKRLGGEPV